MIRQVLPDAVHNQMDQFVSFVKEQGHRQVSNLFLRVFVRRYKIDCFEMAEIDIPPKDVYV